MSAFVSEHTVPDVGFGSVEHTATVTIRYPKIPMNPEWAQQHVKDLAVSKALEGLSPGFAASLERAHKLEDTLRHLAARLRHIAPACRIREHRALETIARQLEAPFDPEPIEVLESEVEPVRAAYRASFK